jgi:hypothetical protein
MRRPRLGLTLAAVVAACFAVFVPSAGAVDPFPSSGIATLSSDHFMLHYSRDDADTTCTNFITQEAAGDVLGMLERAYALYGSWGYTAPIPDSGSGDALIDVSIDDFPNACIPNPPISYPGLLDRWDALIEPVAPTGAGQIHLDRTKGLNYHVIAHQVFHLVEDAIASGTDQWLQEGAAEWAATRANFAASGTELNPDRTLDCVGSECGDSEFDKNGYPGWILFEYLAERFGDSKVLDVWNQAAASAPGTLGTTILANTIAPTTLAAFFNDYTTARLTGSFSFAPLAGQLPAAQASIPVGETTGAFGSATLAVNHLAVRYVTFSHGSDSTAPCFQATLTINVAIPAGVTSKPYYYAHTSGSTAQPLTVSGSNATISVPWNTCAGSPDAYLSLPNDSLGLDGREFVVSGSVTVDPTKPASPSQPPPPVKIVGGVVVAPTTDPAPTLKVYAPEVLRISSKTRLLRFAVFSSGEGKLQAVLGSSNLGTAALRGGNNDVRFVLPQQLFNKLRTKSASNVLALTSMSPSGSKGSTFTRKVLVQVVKKPKPKKKR